jgi:hypothetical protein
LKKLSLWSVATRGMAHRDHNPHIEIAWVR